MSRPPLEMADIVRCAGQSFLDRSRRWMNWQHQKVLLAIARCRTAALGGHRDQCSHCGHSVISYNSCRNRHCPNARAMPATAGCRHVSASCCPPPMCMSFSLCRGNWHPSPCRTSRSSTICCSTPAPRPCSQWLAIPDIWAPRSVSSACCTPGISQLHPHVHCVVPAGGLAPGHSRWISSRHSFFLPIKVLSRVFRGKFVAALKRACSEGKLRFYGDLKRLAQPKIFSAWLRQLFRHDWVVYCKPPFGGPEHAVRYLGAYTHRVAISNHRLVALAAGNVTFRWRDSAHGNKKRLMTLPVDEFLRRFLLHLLPRGFVRIRNFGFLANRQRST